MLRTVFSKRHECPGDVSEICSQPVPEVFFERSHWIAERYRMPYGTRLEMWLREYPKFESALAEPLISTPEFSQ
jgi:hypothetical protein